MNNKGFAITSIVYGLMLLFVVIITSFISVLVGRNRRNDEFLEGVYESLEYEEIVVLDSDFIENKNTAYTTKKKALYYFDTNNDNTADCYVYFPKNVLIVKYAGELLYKTGGGEKIDEYSLLSDICLK